MLNRHRAVHPVEPVWDQPLPGPFGVEKSERDETPDTEPPGWPGKSVVGDEMLSFGVDPRLARLR